MNPLRIPALCLVTILGCAGFASAAVTLNGTAAKGDNDHSGVATPAGMELIWVVDSNNSGGFNTSGITPSQVLAVGQTFGGDLIVGVGSTTNAFSVASLSGGGTTIDESLYAGRQFAAFWFPTLAASASTSPTAGSFFGEANDPTTWIVPASAGPYQFSSPTNPGGGSPFLQIQAAGNANFQVTAAPEPSRSLLFMLGAVVPFLRRRRK
jgi:hypothetical protein